VKRTAKVGILKGRKSIELGRGGAPEGEENAGSSGSGPRKGKEGYNARVDPSTGSKGWEGLCDRSRMGRLRQERNYRRREARAPP